jgi:KaiC/GvpD/RAD55 family RecA-like ATPase
MTVIKIVKNNKPPNSRVEMLCDAPINKKLEKYQLSKEFLNKSNTTCFIGRQGSGKTTLMCHFILKLYKKCFHHIYVIMPESSRRSLKDCLFDKHLKPENIYEELNYATITDIYQKLETNCAENERSLIIYDDVQNSLKDPEILHELKKFVANQRHLKVVNFILVQNYFALHKSLREILNNIIMFKLNKTQTEKVFNEAVESAKDKFDIIRKIVFQKQGDWLFINLPSQRIFNQWDEILYDCDSDSDNDE